MAYRLDRILKGPPRADADAPRTGAPNEGPGRSLERQQRGSSPRRSRVDIPPAPAQSRLKRMLEQAQPSLVKRLKVGAASKGSGSSDPRLPIGAESAPPRPLRKMEEEREQETWRLPQEEQRLQQKEVEEGHPPAGPQLEELLEQDRQRELQELQEQQQLRGQQLEELLEPPSHSPPQPAPPAPQEPRNQEEGLPVFGPPTPAWLRPGAPALIPAESGRADGVVALASMMRTPVDPQSEIRRTIYGMDGIASRFLRERRSWEDCIPAEEDEAGTSSGGGGSKTGTWKTEKKQREAALAEAREASRKVVDEATLLRERAMMVEEVASKAREEALSYKNAVANLDEEKGLLKTELASARETFQRMKVECVNGEIARSATEEAKKKAIEDPEAER
ncbi:uncharacterized protein LOC110431539, partial [Sorghum bicolor]|uniref:uncharacterized protein LOC110431539 n=1 Tax=Sorghum bicolor TaxID=4558 RepID=UPI000B426C04